MNETITVDGAKYRAIEVAGERLRIVIVDNRGLTFIGRCDLSGDGEQILIRDARCIVRWGTDKHLAQLIEGPRPNTTLGDRADVLVFRRQLVAAYDVKEEKWNV